MFKDDYILRMLSKTRYKKWESYVIHRVVHRLGDPEIEFKCQQCVRAGKESRFLLDLYFPQLGIYLEVDEPFHASEDKIRGDASRKRTIAEATKRMDIIDTKGIEEVRISVANKSLREIDEEIERFVCKVREIKRKRVESDSFKPWDEQDFSYASKPHLEKGLLEVSPYSLFRTHKDALECFGYSKGHYRRAMWSMPDDVKREINISGKCFVWFPKLYVNSKWNNSLSNDGKLIIEKNKGKSAGYTHEFEKRIVFAHSKDPFGRTLYRFLGVFDTLNEFQGLEHRYERVATSVRTYETK